MTMICDLVTVLIKSSVVPSLLRPVGPLIRGSQVIQPAPSPITTHARTHARTHTHTHTHTCTYTHTLMIVTYCAALKDLQFVVKALKTLSSRWEDIGMTVNVKEIK